MDQPQKFTPVLLLALPVRRLFGYNFCHAAAVNENVFQNFGATVPMKVFMLQDVERVGLAGEILKVSDGYGANFLIPRKLAVRVTKENSSSFKAKTRTVEKRKEAIASASSMLAEKISSTQVVIKRKMHEDKVYGSVGPAEIVDALGKGGISVSKSMIKIPKSIKAKGIFDVTIKLSSRLQPTMKVKVVAE